MYMNDLKDNNKFSVNMYRIHKNPRYKLIELNQKKYLIDLEANYFFYLFPMLNWILKKELIEITNDKLNEIEYDNKTNKERSQNIRWISGGAGVLMALLMRPFMDLLDVPSNIYINIIIFIILVFSVISIRIYLRKKWDLKLKENNPRMNCKMRPTFKYMIVATGAYLLFLALSIFMFPLIFLEKLNILMCLCSLTFFFFFSIMNIIAFDNEKVIISKLSQSE
ncbi:putative membrane protein (TIGR01218 family) [Staphylococcus epidermidis]